MAELISDLSAFSPEVRRTALEKLAETTVFPEETSQVNMHLHTFFSYNGEGWSPSRIAYEMKKLGIYSAAICDFDVLQGVEEFMAAGELLKLRTAAAFESRVFFNEYADVDINSPGEPGVFYFMGMGFIKQPDAGTVPAGVLADMLARSHARNRDVIARINAAIKDFQLDYDNDVLPLTPDKNATERHIVAAYNAKAVQTFGSRDKAAAAWAAVFGCDAAELAAKAADDNAFNEFLRGKLIKRGGIGYKQPDTDTFPGLDEVVRFILDCRAIPMTAWLDGDSQGESDPVAQLECLAAKGIQAVNIIPDRNWNFKDPQVKARKLANLAAYVKAAEDLDMPINVGTEGNKPGQRLVDDFNAPELAAFCPSFLDGAKVFAGHTRLLRFANLSFTDKDAPFVNKKQRNTFFAKVGALPCPDACIITKLNEMESDKALDYIAASAEKNYWI